MSSLIMLPAESFHAGRAWAASEQAIIDASVRASVPVALIHPAPDGIVVPRSYRDRRRFEAACLHLRAEGLPVSVRLSGGGVVPQSPDVLNLHLALPVRATRPFQVAERCYIGLCRLLQQLFRGFGIFTDFGAVSGSFCDGRFNLAVDGRKIAGTAQCWQRRAGSDGNHVVLLSAVILCAGADRLTERANRFEAALGSEVRYQPEKTTAVAEYCCADTAAVAAALQKLLCRESRSIWPAWD